MREAMPSRIVNEKIAARFDAEDYFGSAPKGFVIKAIAEAINPDEARKAAQGSKRELAVFATKNLKDSGWVPKELRTLHYKPVVARSAIDIATPARSEPRGAPSKSAVTKPATAPVSTAGQVKAAKAKRAAKKAGVQMKRAAAAKKSAKKTSKRKR